MCAVAGNVTSFMGKEIPMNRLSKLPAETMYVRAVNGRFHLRKRMSL